MTTRSTFEHRIAPSDTSVPMRERSARRVMGWLVVAVLAAHLALLWGMTGSLDWRLPRAEPMRVAPLQTRWVPPAAAAAAAPAPVTATPEKPRTRVATVAAVPTAPVVVMPPDSPAQPPSEAPGATEASATESPAPQPAAPSTTAQLPADATAGATRTETLAAPESESESKSGPALPAIPTPQAAPPTTNASTTASTALPPIPLGALPPSVLLRYKLTGQEKGLNYFANGELRWQHNDAAYALSLSVKAFLVGSRHWRSVGEINETGLAPRRFSDSWRNERAAHFDRANQRVVFSNNAPVAPLEAGAQDQISLYVQLAAAMAGKPQRFEPGTRLQVQTATIKDALPWLLTLEGNETLPLNGQAVPTAKWVCQPRNRFDATVAFWVSAQHAWMPVRIRITQVSGSYIDLVLNDQEPLPPLPAHAAPAPASPTPAG